MKRTKGSAHIIIIICLSVALLVVLGYVFYNNFLAKDSATKQGAENTKDAGDDHGAVKSKEELTTVTLNDVFTPGVTYKYPKSWSESRNVSGAVPVAVGESTIQNSTIASEDKSVDATITLMAGGGIGGYCVPEEEKNLDWFAYEKSNNLDGLSYVEYIYQDQYSDNRWVVSQGIGPTSEASSIKVGDTSCKVGFLQIALAPVISQTASENARLRTGITAHGKTDKLTFSTLDAAKTYIASDTAKRVKAVFLSVN